MDIVYFLYMAKLFKFLRIFDYAIVKKFKKLEEVNKQGRNSGLIKKSHHFYRCIFLKKMDYRYL